MSPHNVFEIMHQPAPALLSRHGIQYRTKHEGGVTWYNMMKCPTCGHEDYQCGVSESVGADGKLNHGVKCRHVAGNGFGTDAPGYEDFLGRIGELTPDEVNQIKYVHILEGGPVPAGRYPLGRAAKCSICEPKDLTPNDSLRPLNTEYLAVLKKRLRENGAAIRHLTDRGLTMHTIERFDLGLSKAYTTAGGKIQEDALVYPLRAIDGKLYGKYGYYNLPGVTQNPTADNGWMSGQIRTYYADGRVEKRSEFGCESYRYRTRLLVCQEAKDLWRTWQELQGSKLADEILLVTSTHGSALPSEWKNPGYWEHWSEVYLSQGNDEAGDHVAATLASLTERTLRRVQVPERYGKGWADFWQNGGTLAEFEQLLCEAPAAMKKLAESENDVDGLGEFAYDPIDINGAFHNGHLYYPVRILKKNIELMNTDKGETVVNVEWLETVVVRSDRTYHRATWVPTPRGKRQQDRVLRLDDGSLIDREPQPNKYGTWSWPSIKAYLAGRSRTRLLAETLGDIQDFLRASVWLPYEEDYALLALTVPVTYAQSIFDSVPLIFLNGPAGSGKSQMGRSMARVCANAYVCGTASAVAIAGFIDESRGFVVLDDLEGIGNKGGEFGELCRL